MPMDRVTSIDVAKEAGVSQSAVSRVFSSGGSASARTTKKVHEAAAKLGYRPNILARSLITGKSRIIGVILAYLENQFYPEALEKLSHKLQQQGYHVLVFLASNSQSDIDEVVQEILDYQVDGIIVASASLSSSLSAECEKANIPIVMFNRVDESASASSVTSDNFKGGYEAAAHFVACGHHKISYIAGWEGASTQRDREAGFLEGLKAHGKRLHTREVGNYNHTESAKAARAMFDTSDRPDAVFICNDHMAFAVMDVIRQEFGLAIPQDVAVIGYDDVPPASWPAYSLTTMRQPTNAMVEACVDILMGRIEGNETAPKTTKIPSPLVIRGSTREIIEPMSQEEHVNERL
ncbi:MAG: LacI family DNA-binding transcriptional regulator [Candidatus Puniceispirillaceae bacterium]